MFTRVLCLWFHNLIFNPINSICFVLLYCIVFFSVHIQTHSLGGRIYQIVFCYCDDEFQSWSFLSFCKSAFYTLDCICLLSSNRPPQSIGKSKLEKKKKNRSMASILHNTNKHTQSLRYWYIVFSGSFLHVLC